MMTLKLPECQRCEAPVSGRTATVESIFVEGGEEQTFEIITLSCGCVVEFPSYDVCVKTGTVTLKNGFTGEEILSWHDDEMVYEDDE